MKKLLIAIFVLCCASVVMAKEVTFKFNVNSSGPKIYACNAGLAHKITLRKYCHVPGSQTATNLFGTRCLPCVGGACASISYLDYFDGTQATFNSITNRTNNCACTASSYGNYLKDYMKFKYIGKDQKTVSALNNATVNPLTNSDFATAQAVMAQSISGFSIWGTSTSNTGVASINGSALESVTFNLGSERYGSEYFIDICYMGAQMEYWADSIVATNLFTYNISVTDLLSGGDLKSYVKLANPYVQVYINCDLQGLGTHKCAGNSTTAADQAACAANPGAYDQVPSSPIWIDAGDKTDYYFTANKQFSSIGNFNGSDWVNVGTKQYNAPRFCVVRYYVKENREEYERQWQRHDANFCTNTSIEEPSTTEEPVVTP
ncbi:MAG: hypothetical protein HQK49_11415 [Oligoflexia bacterium]|nr:hypothetical protein [Oligoflexia bacterium]